MIIDGTTKLQIFVHRETRWSRESWRLTLKAKAPRESGGAPLVALVQAADLRDGNHLPTASRAGWGEVWTVFDE